MSCFSFAVISALFLRQHGQDWDCVNGNITAQFPTLGATHACFSFIGIEF
jgi:hypothetical protein